MSTDRHRLVCERTTLCVAGPEVALGVPASAGAAVVIAAEQCSWGAHALGDRAGRQRADDGGMGRAAGRPWCLIEMLAELSALGSRQADPRTGRIGQEGVQIGRTSMVSPAGHVLARSTASARSATSTMT